ncbi:prepilin-type N-terminal cleavage/methylation domain-containing protein [Opitutaceae bacterium TAV4]|nr:prepilin-type N-terminal cleavage/methylation domain-containing protein [Opitutaceae bacterium TAV4]RRJ98467.1 prepilin-type N-terminal cleavage/methylation domain-containing protein [Opitutaceae bacterium TAV3]
MPLPYSTNSPPLRLPWSGSAQSKISRASYGFTLVELLTVIAIIGILAAIIIPTVGKVRESAYRATCTSNMRQIFNGLLLYAQDNKNILPAVSEKWAPTLQQDTWGYHIWNYVGYGKNAFQASTSGTLNDLTVRTPAINNIFACPATRRKPLRTDGVSLATGGNVYAYGLNSAPLNINDYDLYWKQPIPLNVVLNPSRCAMIMECSNVLGSPQGFLRLYGLIPHSGGSNVLFYDGHIKHMKLADIPDNLYEKSFWRGWE